LYTKAELHNMCVFVKTNDKFDTFEKQEWARVKLSNTLGEVKLFCLVLCCCVVLCCVVLNCFVFCVFELLCFVLNCVESF
jgi:hypothetical protein